MEETVSKPHLCLLASECKLRVLLKQCLKMTFIRKCKEIGLCKNNSLKSLETGIIAAISPYFGFENI